MKATESKLWLSKKQKKTKTDPPNWEQKNEIIFFCVQIVYGFKELYLSPGGQFKALRDFHRYVTSVLLTLDPL